MVGKASTIASSSGLNGGNKKTGSCGTLFTNKNFNIKSMRSRVPCSNAVNEIGYNGVPLARQQVRGAVGGVRNIPMFVW